MKGKKISEMKMLDDMITALNGRIDITFNFLEILHKRVIKIEKCQLNSTPKESSAVFYGRVGLVGGFILGMILMFVISILIFKKII